MSIKKFLHVINPHPVHEVIVLTLCFFLVQLVFSHITHALTLLVDSYHVLCKLIYLLGTVLSIKVMITRVIPFYVSRTQCFFVLNFNLLFYPLYLSQHKEYDEVCLNEELCLEKINNDQVDSPTVPNIAIISKSSHISSSSVNNFTIYHRRFEMYFVLNHRFVRDFTVRTSPFREEAEEYVRMGENRSGIDAGWLCVFGFS